MVEAVAGWLVCPIIKIVMDKAKCCASDRIKWLSDGVPKTLQRLENSLEQLRAVAGAVQQRRGSLDRIGELRAWLQQLIDAVYEARDVLDDFDDSVPQPESPVVRVSRRIFGADERVNRLKDVVEKLEAVHRTSTTLMQAAGLGSGSDSSDLSGHHQPQGRATGSVRHHEHVVLGRDRELQDMVSWLVGTSDGDAKPVSVAAITGHGGMGKTTLAQLLFEDQKVISTFELKIWIQPAATDNEFELTRQLLQSANVDVPHGMTNFNWLQMKLQEEVSSRRFLLVIDDVWNWNREDREGRAFQEMWSKVLAPISRGKTMGSKIVITTRQKMSADLLHASKEVWLHDLPPDAIWSLFKKCAFGEEDIDKQPQILQDIGRKIAEKLKGSGSPMAVKAVGQMLEGSRRDTHWKKVLDMDSFDNVSKTLELCYHNLPEHLQPCFAICSLFPKNWRFKRDKLVKIWMALDFIQADGGKIQLEDVGSDYFDQLVDRSFFHRQKVGRRRYYYIHDLMHDMAEKVSRFDCVRVEDAKKEIPKTIRHLSVSSDTVAQLKNLCWLKRLHTLLILKNPSSPLDQLPGDLLTELKGLRVLGLEGCNIVCLSEKIGNLKYLRYLALCKSITRLPQAVTKLYRLQTFSSPKGSGLEVPEDIVNLKRLRHLDMDTSKITGIGKLVHLQGSIKFHVKNEKGHTLADLDGMSGLRKELHIMNLDVVMDQQAACQAGLNKKENVKILELEWNSTGKTVPSVEAEVLDGLEPNQYVKKLLIRRYHGDRSPDWLNTGLKASKFYFKYLHLINCRKWEVLPPLGQLPSLKVLHLKEMCSVKKISGDFYGTNSIAFPSLEELEFDDMPQWVEWVQEEKNIDMLPKLRKLKLLNCPELIKVPHLPLSVRKVSVKNTGFVSQLKLSSSSSSKACKLDTCSATVLTDGLLHQQQVEAIAILTLRNCQDVNFQELQALTSLKRLQISHSNINDEQLGSCLRGLQALTWLGISNCNNIKHLPQMESPDCLTKIHELHIQQCSEFSSLRSLPSFVALESVLIENCSKITMESFPTNFNINSSLRKLSIINCSELESLPSGLPSSLQVLHLIGCKPTLMDQLQLKDGLEWDKVASIPIKQIR